MHKVSSQRFITKVAWAKSIKWEVTPSLLWICDCFLVNRLRQIPTVHYASWTYALWTFCFDASLPNEVKTINRSLIMTGGRLHGILAVVCTVHLICKFSVWTRFCCSEGTLSKILPTITACTNLNLKWNPSTLWLFLLSDNFLGFFRRLTSLTIEWISSISSWFPILDGQQDLNYVSYNYSKLLWFSRTWQRRKSHG